MISAVTVTWIALVIGAFALFHSSLKLLSASQREGFLRDRPFSGTYLWILFAVFVGMSLVDDFQIRLTLGVLAIGCAIYEHWKNHVSIARLDVPVVFKRRMGLIAWLADAVVILVAVDSLFHPLGEA